MGTGRPVSAMAQQPSPKPRIVAVCNRWSYGRRRSAPLSCEGAPQPEPGLSAFARMRVEEALVEMHRILERDNEG